MNVLIKDHLFFKQEAQPLIDANSLVVLFRDLNVAKKFAQSASSWHEQEPAQVPAGQKRQAHPWGPEKVFPHDHFAGYHGESGTKDARQHIQTDGSRSISRIE